MSEQKLNPEQAIPAIAKKEYFRAIDAATSTDELFAYVEQKFGEHFLRASESWGQSADRVEAEGRSDAAEILRKAESKWFELGA